MVVINAPKNASSFRKPVRTVSVVPHMSKTIALKEKKGEGINSSNESTYK